MKRSEFSRILRHMEHVREASHEAETRREEKRLIAEYNRMSLAIRPYTTGAEKLEEDADPRASEGERAAWAAAR
ncbi:hypothetical protein [Methylobacterium gnaphalii]|uniref:Uncharacterized protein n=1 Tax=Methylobacterium gnaphalii TaxID=1010610 RepID=A0A512JPI2_9HYPH|nr:hypothetical protein [Methylobacterium gnaphalii]GEP11773.1 hypothetical protein MGN01_36180 [Methylobacterium gnaphalii]GJD69449.1 hypothetical protein MMMDOFMJ_2380 [Methylobacterium gnaphalii]GLS49592.1 hypothetical protein GCM10007885_24410 [Methylobacterium gnaphalii]